MSSPLQASLVPLVDILDQVHRAIHRDALGHQGLQEEDYKDARHARELKLWDGLASGKVQAFLVNVDGETFQIPKVQWGKDAQFRTAAPSSTQANRQAI